MALGWALCCAAVYSWGGSFGVGEGKLMGGWRVPFGGIGGVGWDGWHVVGVSEEQGGAQLPVRRR